MSLAVPTTTDLRSRKKLSAATAGDVRAPFVVLGGIPGAGKTTALRWLSHDRPDARILDPEGVREAIAVRTPAWLPYRVYRPLVHAIHACRVLVMLVAGPALVGCPLVVHDPATRPRRRQWMARVARKKGWTPVLLMIDIDRASAVAGQHARGRVVRARSFDAHWERWRAERGRPLDESCQFDATRPAPWLGTLVTTREHVREHLNEALVN